MTERGYQPGDSARVAAAMKSGERTAFIRAAVDALPVHSISGYEWDCANCEYDDANQEHDSLGNPCDHMTLVDRELVLGLLDARIEWVIDPSAVPDPNRRGMPKCPRCGDIAYRPEPIGARRSAYRCGGCHFTLSRCVCPDRSEEPT